MNTRKFIGVLFLIGAGMGGGACKAPEGTEAEAAMALAALSYLPQNPGSCSFTFGSSSVNIQEFSLAANTNSTFPSGFTYVVRNWAAVKLPAVASGTTVAFNYNPFYDSSTYGNIYLVYLESGCPVGNSSNTDWNRTSDLSTSRTPTYYTVSGNTLTFLAAAAGKNFTVVSAARNRTGSESVSRSN